MADPAEGSTESEPTPAPKTVVEPAAVTLPAGHVAVSEQDNNNTQAELRRLRKASKDREDADAEAEAAAKQEAAKAVGDFDTALGVEQGRTAAANAKLAEFEVRDQLRDEISAAGYSGEQAKALKKMVDVSAVQLVDGVPVDGAVAQAIKSVTEQFPALFKLDAGDETTTPAARRTAAAPSTPISDGERNGEYLSQEEYATTPWAERQTEEFQARVKRSEHRWPKVVNASTAFEQDKS
jgi:hypothetical protein